MIKIFLLLSFLFFEKSYFTLQQLHVFFRHGERTPLNYLTFPNEIIINDSILLYEPGQLTDNGIKMEYMVGRKLASKYNLFIAQNFSTKENVYATSGIDKRVVESLLTVLAGMFPPSKNEIIYESLNWKPIAIVTNEIYDHPGTGLWNSCPILRNKITETSEYKKIDSSFTDDKKIFSQLTSLNIQTLYDLDVAIDNLQTRYILNNTIQIPLWANTNEMKTKVTQLHNNIQSSFSKLFASKIGGWHHQTIIKNIENFILNKTTNKINLYGVHDTNLMLLSQMYGIPNLNDTLPPYSSYIIFEVHLINNSYFIKTEYGNGSNLLSVDSPVIFAKCDEYCLLSDFESLAPKITTEEWNIECKGSAKFSNINISFMIISTLLNIILLLILFFTILYLFHYKKLYNSLIVNEKTPLIILK
ncbi:Histidine phosphatase superfamily, clade-2-containing protein [Strongyloides ratti]|uniref:Histidine phosphatase superfamily, clade-2-containing protein n=1 Tax=Strongyloides ratti TaxID=34506 RepID=A0A090L6V6_STRRB|nr:Histidine phosphatase superfamily, clade-2-containing protein [Strongyloides ratti]CEF63189.1 Histidine phosphatase superfamily, clade-2-containing protein [Strongyloides ratti]